MAIYGRPRPGRSGQAGSAAEHPGGPATRQAGWQHIATYGDQDAGIGRPGLCRLLAEAPRRIDLLAVDGYGRLASNRRELNALPAQLRGAGVHVVVGRPSPGRRFARMVANLALADVMGDALG